MKISTTAFESSVKRVARGAAPVTKKKMDQGREMVVELWKSAIRITFSIEDSCLYLFATNGDVFAYDKIDVELTDKDKDNFIVYLYPLHLLEHLSLSNGSVEFYKYREGVRLMPSEKQKFYLHTHYWMGEYFDGYKTEYEIPQSFSLKINAMLLKDALRFTTYVTSKETIKTKAVVIENVEGQLCFGATDGWRLALAEGVMPVDAPMKYIVYKELITTLENMIAYEDVDISLYFTDNMLYFRDIDFFAGVLLGTDAYDIWDNVQGFPVRNIVFEPDVEMLKRALHISEHFAVNGAGYISLKLENDTGVMKAESNEIGNTLWKISSAKNVDEPFSIKFNPRAIMEYLSHTNTKKVSINFSSPRTAFSVIGDDPDKMLIVMPVHTSDDNM